MAGIVQQMSVETDHHRQEACFVADPPTLHIAYIHLSTYEGGTGAAASVPVAARWVPGGGGRNMGRYVTISDMSDMPTEK